MSRVSNCLRDLNLSKKRSIACLPNEVRRRPIPNRVSLRANGLVRWYLVFMRIQMTPLYFLSLLVQMYTPMDLYTGIFIYAHPNKKI